MRRAADLDGSLAVFIAVDGEAAGAFLLEDPLRPDAPRMIRTLKHWTVLLREFGSAPFDEPTGVH